MARGQANTNSLSTAKNDVDNAVENAIVNWPQNVDTLCCGTLGSIELLGSAGALFNHPALTELSSHRLAQLIGNRNKLGDYRWDTGSEAFNLGLFRGLSGVGYTVLRRLAPHLPNILIWE